MTSYGDYPYGMTLRPIVTWPSGQTAIRQRSNFSAPWRSTLDLLDRELHYLGTGNRNAPAVLQIAMREQDFRLDGMPRANAVPSHPGVILAIESNKGPLSFPCDRFDRWQDNLRAIALALEALRKIDRYGITPNAEQYTGWKQLGTAADSQTPEAALRYLKRVSGSQLAQTTEQTYRKARANAHPDRNNGDRSQWDRVEEAAAILRREGRLA
ncbi:molecular chaperone DnaJ [Rhodococcoides kyotonense]|uniref:Molecular chaperone DnaJ n=1 Tax=Rhodococcoides kyotonense TaxID=398843 RepID=A0A239FQF6_9NOCA|nr:molecular chaperone DnaJ [Rhodococcus kyotonensis]SNS59050.1 hypothetical protein SAMN05421642_103407 [Rhodococcus kyotonensis]